MPIAYLTTPGITVKLQGQRLEITLPHNPEGVFPPQRWIPLFDIEQVVVDASIHLSPKVMTALLYRNIPVIFLSNGHFPAGIASPFQRQTKPLAEQLDASRDGHFRLAQAKEHVVAKIRNMRRLIQRFSSHRNQAPVAASWLKAMMNQAAAAQGIDSLRGIEGASSGRYFQTIGQWFPTEMPFERRSRRPPHNPVNSLLSYLYTILTAEFSLHLHATGLEPGWGFYHETEDGRPSLSLDLVEPFRAPLVDALVLDLINHHRLTATDFEKNDGVWMLKRPSRRPLFTAWEDRLEREFHHQQSNQRTTLRREIQQQCIQVKQAFQRRAPFTPFLMN